MVNMKAKAKPTIRKNERIRMVDIHSTDGSDSDEDMEAAEEVEEMANHHKGAAVKQKLPQKRSLDHVKRSHKGSSSSPLKEKKNFTSSTPPLPQSNSDDESSLLDEIEEAVNRPKRNGAATTTPSPLDSLADEVEEAQSRVQRKRKAKNTSNGKSRKKSVAKGKKKAEEESEEEESDIDGDYVPEKIIAHKWLKKRGKKITHYQYKVRWEGYGEEDDTWEPEHHLKDTPWLIRQYWLEKQKKSSKNEAKEPSRQQKSRKLDLATENTEDEESDKEVKKASTSRTKLASKSVAQRVGKGKEDKHEEMGEEVDEESEEVQDENIENGNEEEDDDEDEEEEDEDEIEMRNQEVLNKFLKIRRWDPVIRDIVQMRENDEGSREVKVVSMKLEEFWCSLALAKDRAKDSLLNFYESRTQIKKKD